MLRKWLSTAAILISVCGGIALGNYAATQGMGTNFGSIVIGGVHFVSSLFCDATTANQCAAVSAGGAVKVDNSAVTQPVSGTITANAGTNLNTSALAISANQPTAAAQASTTSGQTGLLVQCAVTTGSPTYVTAQTDPLSCDTNGNVRVNVANANANGQATMGNSSPVVVASNQSNIPVNVAAFGGTATTTGQVAVNTAPVTATNTALVVDLRPDSPGIITLGPAAAANAVPFVGPAPSSSALVGITPVVGGSAASSLVLKNAAGNLYSVYAECSAACWLMVFNSTSAPSNGSTTAGVASGNMVECIPISAGGFGSVNYAGGPPAVYSVGITAAISSTTCATLTLATTGFIHGMVM